GAPVPHRHRRRHRPPDPGGRAPRRRELRRRVPGRPPRHHRRRDPRVRRQRPGRTALHPRGAVVAAAARRRPRDPRVDPDPAGGSRHGGPPRHAGADLPGRRLPEPWRELSRRSPGGRGYDPAAGGHGPLKVPGAGMSEDLTRLLHGWRGGDADARDRLLEEVYGTLRRMAASRLGRGRGSRTLQPTAVVNEALISLLGNDVAWEDRA